MLGLLLWCQPQAIRYAAVAKGLVAIRRKKLHYVLRVGHLIRPVLSGVEAVDDTGQRLVHFSIVPFENFPSHRH